MTYKSYIRKNGSDKAIQIIKDKKFPKYVTWDNLSFFINTRDIPESIITELEQLYDNYYLHRQEVREWLTHRLKTALQGFLMKF